MEYYFSTLLILISIGFLRNIKEKYKYYPSPPAPNPIVGNGGKVLLFLFKTKG